MKKIVILFLGAAFGGALPALAAEGGDAAAETSRLTLGQLMQMGGALMYVLTALSVVGLALILYYAVVLRQRTVAPEAQAVRLRELLKERRTGEARNLCAREPTALARVVGTALDFVQENPGADASAVKEVMESEGGRQASRMQHMIHYLMDISSVAPMVGLLGTVIGMLRAFNTVAFDLAKARPMELAAGVGQALITTIAGLVVAIPALVAYAVFRGRVMKLTGQLEVSSSGLLSAIASQGRPAAPRVPGGAE
jgi:biopolymer transport protein ExbB